MCSGRIDLEFILRAFANGQDGVLIGGCKLNECNYVTHGNYGALANTYICKMILSRIGLNPERLSVAFMSSGESHRLAEVVDSFTAKIRELGPLGEAEGIEPGVLAETLEASRKLVPYLRLVEREKLRPPVRSEQAYREFYGSDEVSRLFDELFGAKLAVSRIIGLLPEAGLSTGEISRRLGLEPSAVARMMNSASRQGLVRYDLESRRYTLGLRHT